MGCLVGTHAASPADSARVSGGARCSGRYLVRAMYAVIASGGKQTRVAEGEQVHLELLGADADEVELRPVLLVDGDTILATPQQLEGVAVKGRVGGIAKGPKIDGFVYKRRTNQRRRYGHRQRYSVVEITSITKG